MDITYFGHSCFKLRGKNSSVVTDPYDKNTGLTLPKISADIITSSHDHHDHNYVQAISNTSRRDEPFIINAPGEYEIGRVSIFSVDTYHDTNGGADRGKNTAYMIHIDDIKIAHLGDLGHELSDKQVEQLNGVDVLLCPVGGYYTINPKQAVKVVNSVQPGFVIPMHYKTKDHNQKIFGKIAPLSEFLSEMGASEVEAHEKLTVSSTSLPEETEVVVLSS